MGLPFRLPQAVDHCYGDIVKRLAATSADVKNTAFFGMVQKVED